MASQNQLEGTRVTRKGDSNTKVWHPHLQGWLQEDNVLTGQPLHPNKTLSANLTDSSKAGWGAHLNEHTAGGT